MLVTLVAEGDRDFDEVLLNDLLVLARAAQVAAEVFGEFDEFLGEGARPGKLGGESLRVLILPDRAMLGLVGKGDGGLIGGLLVRVGIVHVSVSIWPSQSAWRARGFGEGVGRPGQAGSRLGNSSDRFGSSRSRLKKGGNRLKKAGSR